MMNLNLIGPLIHLFQPEFKAVNDKVEWISIWTTEKLSAGKEEERILLLNLETEEIRHAIKDNKTEPRRYYNFQGKILLLTLPGCIGYRLGSFSSTKKAAIYILTWILAKTPFTFGNGFIADHRTTGL